MLKGLGAEVRKVRAPFDPEGGAYGQHNHDPGHRHGALHDGRAMADPLYRLLAWLSPAYPIGAFSYSHGIETAVEEGFIKDRASLVTWLQSVLLHGHRRGRRRAVRRGLARRRGRGLARLRRHRRARRRVARHVRDGARIAPAGRLVPVDHAHRLAASRSRCGARAPGRRDRRCRSPWRWPPRRTASPSSWRSRATCTPSPPT